MLTGEFQHSLDPKGRIFLPARWREELKSGVVITAGLEDCLFLMTNQEFEKRAEQLGQLSPNHKASRDFSRIFFSSSSPETVDKSGRVSIPAPLRARASLSKEVMLLGVSTRAEIWDREKWTNYREGVESDFEVIAEQLNV